MSLKQTLIPFTLFLLLGSFSVWAQPGRDLKNPQEKAGERIQMLKMWKLIDALKLDREESAKLFAISSQYEEAKKKFRRELMEDIQKLRFLMRDGHPQEKELREVMSRIKTRHRDLLEIKQKQQEEEMQGLKPEQQARYILFQVDFHRDLENLIREVREGRSPRPAIEGGPEKGR